MFSRILLIAVTILSAHVFVLAADAPGWLTQLAALKPRPYEKDVKAVVLRKEQHVTLDADGKLVTVDRYAVRILTREGRREAAAIAFYLSKFSQVRDMEAWLIGPTGT